MEKNVNLTLKGLDKGGRNAIYTGAAVSLRFPLGAFPDKTAPATIEVAGVAGPRPKLTAEERKARRKALTPAERLAKMEERLARMRAKLAAAPTAEVAPKAPKVPAAPATTTAKKGGKR